MIIKFYELNKLNFEESNFLLFYGKNEGLKNQYIEKIKLQLKTKISNYDEKQILENKDEFIEDILSGDLFDNGKIIIINRASDKILNIIEELKDRNINNKTFILNSDLLDKKSKIRNLFEKSKKKLISVAFYPDTNETLFKLAYDFLKEKKISLANESINFLVNKCNYDRKNLFKELEKIELFSINKKNITSDNLLKLVNLNENHDVNELINFCLAKNQKKTLNILNENNYSNEDAIIIIRTLLKKTKILKSLLLQLKIDNNLDTTINKAKPPIFWKEKDVIKKQIKLWSIDKIKNLINEINDLELLVKKKPIKPMNFIYDFLLEKSL